MCYAEPSSCQLAGELLNHFNNYMSADNSSYGISSRCPFEVISASRSTVLNKQENSIIQARRGGVVAPTIQLKGSQHYIRRPENSNLASNQAGIVKENNLKLLHMGI
ncbi:hypothetical protein TWF569_008158 [Orbilia oligospora]|uniref:Uncharacterized protein n=1 Tax=Orbilia oligospora TaxID=2813651 RepID=A0A7C8JX33_ORBOL|nr:hypothetical protein TWF706_006432 [Orbilia oligospora]KAF3085340.1 hypothetical protein TWF102_011652 [Orbilia oligospora]KAF3090230.1 hypothetical protein TWF103_011955 [Orbilia oligospora]KAF3118614.1 hypothetical protein TWF594_006419 [Orbilia oligospora]KAF3140843.1 hypothetical protein TWF569_008158 [Orbilia oligospora]